MKQTLESFIMIVLNSSREAIAQYEFLPTKVIYSVCIKIDLSRRTKWQPPPGVTYVVKAQMKCSPVSVAKFGQNITN